MNVIHKPLNGPKKYEVKFVNLTSYEKDSLIGKIGRKPDSKNLCASDTWEVGYCLTKETIPAIVNLSGVECRRLMAASYRHESDWILDSFQNLVIRIFPSLARDELESLYAEMEMLKEY